MSKLSVIVLVGREELHIGRCLERLRGLCPQQIFVVESQSGDQTHEIAVAKGALTVFHIYPGNQAEQFNWALDNLKIEAPWILRLDADEYLTDELTEEIKQRLPILPGNVEGVVLKRRHYFAGGWAKHGTYPVRILRLFRTGKGRYAPNQLMDERIEVSGRVIEFENDFVDHSLISMDEWRAKHRDYARREAQQVVNGKFHDPRKIAYYKLPPYFRAFVYFCIRYFLKGGFLDGKTGWMWNFWQGLWYRWIVDREIGRLRPRSEV